MKASENKGPRKLSKLPPAPKILDIADDFKVGNMIIVHLASKKGNYLGEVRKVWLPVEEAPGETEKWIRVHLWGRTSPGASTFAPWWIDGKRKCYLRRAPQYGELWEDVYASWIRYKLKLPLEGGELQPDDVRAIKELWGHSLEIS